MTDQQRIVETARTPPSTMNRKRLAVDIGGTFTDVVIEWPGGRISRKLLTTPDAPERAVLEAVAGALDEARVQPRDLDLLVHGTTLATNAIIERKGAVTALVTVCRSGARSAQATVLLRQAGFERPARCSGRSTRPAYARSCRSFAARP
jgi:rhodanese-related sulfurtransferase